MPAFPPHSTPVVDRPWDTSEVRPRVRSGESRSYYARIFAWYDPRGDEGVKSTYKMTHHHVSEDGEPGAANVRAAIEGIALLNGARQGVDIPSSDRLGVWRHLARHLRDADREPPPLRMLAPAERPERGAWGDFELRVSDLGPGERRIAGLAAVYDSPSEPIGSAGFVEVIRPGAFSRAIREAADVRALWQHDPAFVLGRTRAGTLRLAETSRGLEVEIDPPDTTWARDAIVSIARGDVTGMSFGFRVLEDEWREREDGTLVREIHDLELYEVSPVTFPAYTRTEVFVRALEGALAGPGRLHETEVRCILYGAERAEAAEPEPAPRSADRAPRALWRAKLELAERAGE